MNPIQAILIAAVSTAPVQIPAAYLSNYDGDTVILTTTVQNRALSADADFTITERVKVRVENIDTPEINGECRAEEALAVRARNAARNIMIAPQARIVLITAGAKDKYGRLLGRIEVNGSDLGETLIGLGLARRWDGSRHPWC